MALFSTPQRTCGYNRVDTADIVREGICPSSGAEPLPMTPTTTPTGSEDHLRCADRFRKFSTVTDSSTAYENCVVIHSDPICSVLKHKTITFLFLSRSGHSLGQ